MNLKPRPKPIELVGIDALTVPQARALLKAALAVLMQIDNGARDDFMGRERESLAGAIRKLEFQVRGR